MPDKGPWWSCKLVFVVAVAVVAASVDSVGDVLPRFVA
jgi:hypothetical protein